MIATVTIGFIVTVAIVLLNLYVDVVSKFQVLLKRWIVERSFSWLENFRRLTIDYEFLAETAEAMVQIAFIQIMLNKFIE